MTRRTQRQAGVAIITALVVVAAATVAVAAMMWRQSIAVRKVENQNALSQARWLARSSIDWSRLMLQVDARTSAVDHLGEIWATPLADTRVTEDLTAGTNGSAPTAASTNDERTASEGEDAAYVSGRIRDAQARLNLTGLAKDGDVDEQRFAVLARLVAALGLRADVAKVLARDVANRPRAVSAQQMTDELIQDHQLDRAEANRLLPFIVVLPVSTPVNINTADAEVLSACFTDLPLDAARALVRTREQAWFNQISDATARLPGTSGQVPPNNVSVSSGWFELEGHVRVGRADLGVTALIQRDPNGNTRVRSFTES
jgi:general secretion pathway protein K